MSPAEPTLQDLRAAARGTSPVAWFQLAQALVSAQNPEEAAQWHRRSADAGYAPAQVELARMLLHGVGVPADPGRAVAWLLRAEAAGHPVASYFLALICLGGVAMPRDAHLNERVLAAANAGFAPALRAAAIHLGRKPDPADQRQCIAMLEGAASRGDAVAALLLAERLRNGEGCEVDSQRADALLEQLAAHGAAPLPPLSVSSVATTNGAPGTLELYDAMVAPAAQKLADGPAVSVIDGLLSADECRLLIVEKTRWEVAVFLNLNFDFPFFLLERIAGTSFVRNPRAKALDNISRWISFPSDSSSRESRIFLLYARKIPVEV